MYIYIDESGNFGWPLKEGSEPYIIFSVLVIHNLRSKHAISQAVSRAIVDLRQHHPSCKSDPSRRIAELKGSGELRDRPDVRLRFFKRIVKKANFSIYGIILDKRIIKQQLPNDYMERYSALLLNILHAIKIPKNQKWVTMVVDSQERADPTKPLKVRYSSKKERLRQNRIRAKDKQRRHVYTDMITTIFKDVLKRHGTHLHVWHVRSNDDYCLQAADAIGYFIYQRLRLDEEREKLKQGLTRRELDSLYHTNKWNFLKNDLNEWRIAFEVVKPKIELLNRPRIFMRREKQIGKSKRIFRERKKMRDNREA